MPSAPALIRRAGNAVLDAYGQWRAERYDIQQTIAVFCTGRGGSTWLAQVLASPPGHHILWEPLHWKTDPGAREKGFGVPRYIPRGEEVPEARAHLRSVLTGATLSPYINSQRYFHPLKLLRLRSYVVKFVTANMMLPWLCDTLDFRAVFMVRHPCAVVSSQLTHGAWDGVGKSFCKHEGLFRDYPHLGELFESIEHPEEVLAFNWAIQNFVPLNASPPAPWITTTYEDLVERGREEVDRIFELLDRTPSQRTYDLLHTPSATTVSESNVASGRNPLLGWRNRLTPQQIDRILSVTQEAGIEGYTADLHPTIPLVPTGP
jgi:hypothetical protein